MDVVWLVVALVGSVDVIVHDVDGLVYEVPERLVFEASERLVFEASERLVFEAPEWLVYAESEDVPPCKKMGVVFCGF